jgi:hypothetical protein
MPRHPIVPAWASPSAAPPARDHPSRGDQHQRSSIDRVVIPARQRHTGSNLDGMDRLRDRRARSTGRRAPARGRRARSRVGTLAGGVAALAARLAVPAGWVAGLAQGVAACLGRPRTRIRPPFRVARPPLSSLQTPLSELPDPSFESPDPSFESPDPVSDSVSFSSTTESRPNGALDRRPHALPTMRQSRSLQLITARAPQSPRYSPHAGATKVSSLGCVPWIRRRYASRWASSTSRARPPSTAVDSGPSDDSQSGSFSTLPGRSWA